MGRKARPAMSGLEELGFRLKDLRVKAGISQMELSRRIGFNPTHGYKYILRLEKGSVPNPTLRTIAACLEACGATWQDIVDVLPATGQAVEKKPRPASKAEPQPATLTAVSKSASESDSAPSPQPPAPGPSAPPPRRRDSRPMREQLRARRLEERTLKARRFWTSAKQTEEATRGLLHSQRVPSTRHADYLAFVRACCSTVDAIDPARPELIDRELGKLAQDHATKGLDKRLLSRIQQICTAAFRTPDTA